MTVDELWAERECLRSKVEQLHESLKEAMTDQIVLDRLSALERQFVTDNEEIVSLRARIAEQKLRLECHVRDEAALRAEVGRLKAQAESDHRDWWKDKARMSELEAALEAIIEAKHYPEIDDIARAALEKKP